ncbi:MAG: bis-aminopropyl spermidine synthase family protein [Candidatus Heimdallarchaeaceae archaeon]
MKCKRIMNESDDTDNLITKITQVFTEVEQGRGLPDPELDQYYVTRETSIQRALLEKSENYDGKRIILLGDMDLTALTIGLVSKPKDLAVMDIDKRMPEIVFKLKFNYKIKQIRYVNQDIRIRMIAVLKNQFNYIFIEPPMTEEGLEVGLSRAIQCAKKDEYPKIFLSFDIEENKRDVINNLIKKMNVKIIQHLSDFNKYEYNTSLNKKTSDLYILEVNPDSKETIENHYFGPLYYRECSKSPQEYLCKCGEICRVGPGGEYSSLKDLEEKGCSKCNYKGTFLYKSSIKIE